MVFTSAPWVPDLPSDVPDFVTTGEFVLNETYGRSAPEHSQNPFTCALTGKTCSLAEVRRRVEALASGLNDELGWRARDGIKTDEVVGVISVNTIDTLTLVWAIHRCGGVPFLAHATNTVPEFVAQLTKAKCRTVFTCKPLLPLVKAISSQMGSLKVFLLDSPMPETVPGMAQGVATLDDLVEKGSRLEPFQPVQLRRGEGKTRAAVILSSSGTSGLQKMVKISHYNVITNILQNVLFEKASNRPSSSGVNLGLLPMSHAYGLVVSHAMCYRGDAAIVFPDFNMQQMLKAIQTFRISRLYLVPPIVMAMIQNHSFIKNFDLSSVTEVVLGAAPFSKKAAERLHSIWPDWRILQGYGLTETSVVITHTSTSDVFFGSCGSLVAGTQLKLLAEDGTEVTEHDQSGEIYLKSPSIVSGYLDDDEANARTFLADGWMRTGDVGKISVSPAGYEHLFLVDRVKDLIKVKGEQVVPVTIEALVSSHPAVADVAVIGVTDEISGELPRAYVVLSKAAQAEKDEEKYSDAISDLVEENLSPNHRLRGGVEFMEALPRAASGKILKHVLVTKARAEATG